MRFLMPAVPPLAVLAGASYARLLSLLWTAKACRVGLMIQGGLALLVLLNVPPFMHLHKDRVGWLGKVMHRVPLEVVTGRIPADRYLASTVRSYAAWRYVGSHLPEDARILPFTAGDNYYSDRERLWAHTVVARHLGRTTAEVSLQNFFVYGSRISCSTRRNWQITGGRLAVAGENFRHWLSLNMKIGTSSL
jgi:hypothetical protein